MRRCLPRLPWPRASSDEGGPGRDSQSGVIPPVRWGLVAWWTAWALSATALFVNQVLYRGELIGPGPQLGIAALIIQAVMLVFVARRNRFARALTILFFMLSAFALQILPRLVAER